MFRPAFSWDRTVAGTTGKFAFLEYDDALSWMNKSGFVPTIEIAGSTETFHSSTQVAIQPEIIFARIGNTERKFAISREVVTPIRCEIRRGWRGSGEKNRLPAINENFGIFMRFSTHVRQVK